MLDGFAMFAMAPLDRWPPGFYRLPVPIVPLHVVVVSEVPKVRDTLLLRLLGAGRVLREALEQAPPPARRLVGALPSRRVS